MSDFSEEDIKEFLKFKKLMEKENNGSNKEESITSVDLLEQKFFAFFKESPKFEVRDIVRWKKGLKNKKYPKEDQMMTLIL